MNKRLHALKRPFSIALLLVIAFAAGMVFNYFQHAQADAPQQDDATGMGYNNTVYEVSSAGTPDNPVIVHQEMSPNSPPVRNLLWGDRVLFRNNERFDQDGDRWVEVYTAEGDRGWMIANLLAPNPVVFISESDYTTPGIERNVTVTVTQDGDAANFRQEPSVQADRIRKLQAGESLTVIGGPYQAEYFIWWQLRDSTGVEGWLVDIEGWLSVNTAP
jgi:SH3-like domain-containing protein